jgi:hypothetical protein
MSSSYSPDLRIELIGTGDQAGIWGNTTNTNLGTLLENAIAGYTSVSIIASPQALTANDGAADQARFAALALTTTTGANFTVCIPPNSKLYTFYNASAYTATITNSTVKNGTTASGGTTVAIPAGKTMAVWSDGTNVAQQTDHFVGTPTAPTASFGTSTTQLATTAFVQAALQALHPVGSIYTSTSSTNPGTSFGFGTWIAYGAGRVLIGNGGGYTAGSTGGSADAIVVSHSHTATSTSSFSGSAATTGVESNGHTHGFSGTSGGMNSNATHNHSATSTDSGHGHQYKTYGLGNNGLLGNAYTNYDWGYATSGTGYANITTSIGNTNIDHTHSYSGTTVGVSVNHTHSFTPAGSVSTSTTVASSGSSGTGANLPPYVVVYMWNRTA